MGRGLVLMEKAIVEFHGPDQLGQVVVGGGTVRTHHVHPDPAAGEGLGGAGPLVTPSFHHIRHCFS